MRKRICGVILGILLMGGVYAQLHVQKIELKFGPHAGTKIMWAENDNPITPPTWYPLTNKYLVDSLRKVDKFKAGFGGGLHLGFSTFNRFYFSIGADYRETGFRRRVSGYKFRDSVRYLGTIEATFDNSQGNYLTYRFRYHFIQIPVMFHYSLSPIEAQSEEMNTFISFGIAPAWLIRNNYFTRIYGWSINEETTFAGEDVQYINNKFNLNVMLGARFQYRFSDPFVVSAEPMLNFSTMSQIGGGLSMYPLSLGVQAGIQYNISDR